jgi:hypothetical protein
MADGILDTEPGAGARARPLSEADLALLKATDFWANVEKSDGCWRWTGKLNNKGYGRYSFNGDPWGAHRLAFALGKDTALPGVVFVCHRCDNRACVNPGHLFLGTVQDNNQDMIAKGRNRAPRGMANPRCKLTDQDIQEIRARAATTRQADLCRMYGISDGHMSRIVSGKKRPGSGGRVVP